SRTQPYCRTRTASEQPGPGFPLAAPSVNTTIGRVLCCGLVIPSASHGATFYRHACRDRMSSAAPIPATHRRAVPDVRKWRSVKSSYFHCVAFRKTKCQAHKGFRLEVAMSAAQDLFFGLFLSGAITALIVTVAVVLGRRETRESNVDVEDWMRETIRKAG